MAGLRQKKKRDTPLLFGIIAFFLELLPRRLDLEPRITRQPRLIDERNQRHFDIGAENDGSIHILCPAISIEIDLALALEGEFEIKIAVEPAVDRRLKLREAQEFERIKAGF